MLPQGDLQFEQVRIAFDFGRTGIEAAILSLVD